MMLYLVARPLKPPRPSPKNSLARCCLSVRARARAMQPHVAYQCCVITNRLSTREPSADSICTRVGPPDKLINERQRSTSTS